MQPPPRYCCPLPHLQPTLPTAGRVLLKPVLSCLPCEPHHHPGPSTPHRPFLPFAGASSLQAAGSGSSEGAVCPAPTPPPTPLLTLVLRPAVPSPISQSRPPQSRIPAGACDVCCPQQAPTALESLPSLHLPAQEPSGHDLGLARRDPQPDPGSNNARVATGRGCGLRASPLPSHGCGCPAWPLQDWPVLLGEAVAPPWSR